MSQPANFIGESHPSFGHKQMWFMFSMTVRGSITKVFLVNAQNPWAIQCIERVLGTDQKASPTCNCLAVFRDCNIGVRSDMVEELGFQEFMEVIVDKDRFLSDSLTIHAFQKAISYREVPESTKRALPPPRRHRDAPTPVVVSKNEPEAKKTQPSARRAQVLGILTGLGYKAAQVEPVLGSLDVNFDDEDINKVVHMALQGLAGR